MGLPPQFIYEENQRLMAEIKRLQKQVDAVATYQSFHNRHEVERAIAAERERCAKVADEFGMFPGGMGHRIAAAIRGRD